jgi:hypothetical protein
MAGYTDKSGKRIWTLEKNDIEKAKDLGLDIMDIIPKGYDDYEVVDRKSSGGKVKRSYSKKSKIKNKPKGWGAARYAGR